MPTLRNSKHMAENDRTGLYVVLALVIFVIVLALAYAFSGNQPEHAAIAPNPPVTGAR